MVIFGIKNKDMTVQYKPLNSVQQNLLALFSRSISESEQNDIQEMLLNYYDKMLQNEVQKVIQEKGYTSADFEAVLNNSQRTKP
jgi:hypothetical protein